MCPTWYTPDRSSVSPNTCRNCGAMLSPQFTKVFGDNQDQVFGCIRCQTSEQLLR